MDYLNWSTFLEDVSANNNMNNADFGLLGLYRIDNTSVNNAYDYLVNSKSIIIEDVGKYPISELELMTNITFPNFAMTNVNTGLTDALNDTEQYTIITDSGGINNYYDNLQDISHNYTFTDGVTMTVYLVSETTDDILRIYDTNINGTLLYDNSGNNKIIIDISNITNIYIEFVSNSSTITSGYIIIVEVVVPIIAKICFRKGTLVDTDQGSVEIEKIDKSYHTIRSLKIIQITKTLLQEQLVTVESDAINDNVPCINTTMSRKHIIVFQGKLVPIEELVNDKTIYYINNGKEIVYNVMLETYNYMIINNMMVETLHPNNTIGKLLKDLDSYSNVCKSKLIKEINHVIKRTEIQCKL
jgi:hypothetical protein